MKKTILFAGIVWSTLALLARGDQPIFSKMPRWSDGYGIQFVQEYRHKSDLLLGGNTIGRGLSEDVHILNIEAVYTWERWIRLTAKLPYVLSAEREIFDDAGNIVKQRDQGIGDLTLALPLKHYFNLDGRSGSWTLAPQLRIPTAGSDSYEIGDGEWGGGLSLGYETETRDWFFAVGVSAWVFDGDEPFQASASLDFGRNIFAFDTGGQLTWETDFIWEDDGSQLLTAGPALYWKFTDTVHFKAEWKHDFYDQRGVADHGNGDTIKIGFGFVY